MNYYLAIDIGASSGRHILGYIENGKIILEEVYRFKNSMELIDNSLCWNVDYLFNEIINGLKKCKIINKIPKSIAIDTWAVDFALLNNNKLLGNVVSYRDHRTDQIDEEVYKIISLDNLYQKTGIQKQKFNSIYQLMALKIKKSEIMEKTETFLLVPDYFNFLLTGKCFTEYTNATTTQLIDSKTNDWDRDLIKKLGFPDKIFTEIVKPGTSIGSFTEETEKIIGYNSEVIAGASHDTASAVVSVPSIDKDFVYISSGTWSLMGTELEKCDCSLDSMKANFTNEGGYNYQFRYLKNIMGLWIIQSLQKELDYKYTFEDLCRLAKENNNFPSRINVNDNSFLTPVSMIETIQDYCQKTKQPIPWSPGELAYVIYQSLANSYATTLKELQNLTNKNYNKIYIIGGGANADYLNELTKIATGKNVYAGPIEATATGNIGVQMIKDGIFSSLSEYRKAIMNSFNIKIYEEEKIEYRC